jgi:hypothetical protein
MEKEQGKEPSSKGEPIVAEKGHPFTEVKQPQASGLKLELVQSKSVSDFAEAQGPISTLGVRLEEEKDPPRLERKGTHPLSSSVRHLGSVKEGDTAKSPRRLLQVAADMRRDAELREHIKARKYNKAYFENARKEQIGLTTLLCPRHETTIIKLPKAPTEEAGGPMKYERPPSLDSNEQIQDMDLFLNTVEMNTTLKNKLEKAIIDFNQSPVKALEYLWHEQIVTF